MSHPSFLIKEHYRPKDKDILLFPFLNKEEPCFAIETVPQDIALLDPPDKEGDACTLFAGQTGKKRVVARGVRLDAKFMTAAQAMKQAVADHLARATEEGCDRLVVFLDGADEGLVQAVHEGAVLGGYIFDKYLDDPDPTVDVMLVVQEGKGASLAELVERNATVLEWVNFARDILNEPPNVMEPVSLAKKFQEKGKNAGLKLTLWDEKRLLKEGCGGIIAVGKGAPHPPRLVIGEYRPKNSRLHIALVGKGITFDTGGYCLKPANSQIGMKYDMAGAAMVFSAACAIASLELPIRLTVVTPLAENDISKSSYHTTDVITMRSGKSVQVDNTDAEGRLILADSLTIAAEKKPDYIIDAATLTGACVVALGEDIAGAFGTDDKLIEEIMTVGRESGEHFWHLPLHMPYMEQLKTTIADMKNIGGKWGGSITAALFLKQFVPEDVPWVHLDIAGPAIKEEPMGHLGKGAKGFGVKTLVALAEKMLT